MSIVFLTDAFVYKLKRPIQLQSLDYRSLASRKHFCFESLRLNRRLAASVYIDVVSLVRDDNDALQFDGEGEVVEWLEKMKRLPAESMLDNRLAKGTVSVQEVEAVAHLLTDFYTGLEPVAINATTYRQRLQYKIEFHIQALSHPELAVPKKLLHELSDRLSQFVTDRSELLGERVDAGHIVEGHGDLRPEHVCLTETPVIIDCLEFDRDLRTLDVADELSYLAMETELLGQESFGQQLLATYSKLSGDQPDPVLVNFYKAYRAMIRATLAAWHLADYPPAEHPHWIGRCADYCNTALGYARLLSA